MMKSHAEKTPRPVAERHAEPALRRFSEGGVAESTDLEEAIKANLKAFCS